MSQVKARLASLGYSLSRNMVDVFGRKWRYRTSPAGGNGGSTNYFDSAPDVARYVGRVEQVREWQNEILPIAAEL